MLDIEKKQCLARIRQQFAALGYPVDNLTDEEIEQGITSFGRALSSFGLTLAEAGMRISKAFKSTP